jgi:N-dimethylarginine dimethylaminohydrolase
MTAPISVHNEYGQLREVILGRGIMRYPDAEKATWFAEGLAILPPEEAQRVRDRSGKHSYDLPKHDLIEHENDQLIEILEPFGVTIHRPDEITDEQVTANFGAEWLSQGYIQTFARDVIFVVGDNVIELQPGTPLRRADYLGMRHLLAERLRGSGAHWFQMPAVDITTTDGSKESRELLEGGDLLVLGKTVLAGRSLNPAVGSSALGVAWLASVLAPQGYVVEEVPLGREYLHLDVVLSIPREGLAIACRDAFVNGLPRALDGWDIIEVSADEARFMAVNGLPINSEHYVLPTSEQADGAHIKEELEARGITVHSVPFGNHMEDGGAVRCATHPLVRD